jgi:hypothetical protein
MIAISNAVSRTVRVNGLTWSSDHVRPLVMNALLKSQPRLSHPMLLPEFL